MLNTWSELAKQPRSLSVTNVILENCQQIKATPQTSINMCNTGQKYRSYICAHSLNPDLDSTIIRNKLLQFTRDRRSVKLHIWFSSQTRQAPNLWTTMIISSISFDLCQKCDHSSSPGTYIHDLCPMPMPAQEIVSPLTGSDSEGEGQGGGHMGMSDFSAGDQSLCPVTDSLPFY